MTETASPIAKVSFIFLGILLISFVLSIVAFYQAVEAYNNQDSGAGFSFIMIGVSGLALSTYMLFQTRRRRLRLNFKPEKITTEALCQKCGFKTLREFKDEDYVFKEAEECPKCNEKMMITSIYREVAEKKKR